MHTIELIISKHLKIQNLPNPLKRTFNPLFDCSSFQNCHKDKLASLLFKIMEEFLSWNVAIATIHNDEI